LSGHSRVDTHNGRVGSSVRRAAASWRCLRLPRFRTSSGPSSPTRRAPSLGSEST
jgi:hypothetical protein